MIAITLEYNFLGFLWRRRIDARMPARWSEMTPDQIVAIPGLSAGKINESKLLQIYLGISRNLSKRIDSYQRHCIVKHLQYLSKPEPINFFIIPKIAGFNRPGKNLKGVSFGAFIFGDTYYQNFITGDKGALDKFIACYYLGKSGFDEKQIEARSLLISKADSAIREAIAINYGLIREWLAKTFTYVFQKGEPGKKNEKFPGWVKVFDKIVGRDIIHQNDYAMVPAMEMLRYLNETTKEYYKNGGKV